MKQKKLTMISAEQKKILHNNSKYLSYLLKKILMSKVQKGSSNYLILGTSQNVINPINPPTYTNLDGSLNMAVDFINVVAVDSKGLVYVGGGFSTIGGVAANNVAVYNPTTRLWSSLGTGVSNGVNNAVRAIAIDANDNVYFGGIFSSAGGSTSNGIARWNPSSSTWSPIGGPDFAFVLSIKINPYNSNVYVGGIFTSIGPIVPNPPPQSPSTTAANYMAIYNPTTNLWSQFDNGSDSPVTGFVFTPTNTYICGYFSQVYTSSGSITANGIASFNTSTNTWSTFGTGFNSTCSTMIGVGNLLYVGGQFTSANGDISNQYITQINTTTGVYSSLAGGPTNSVDALVYDTTNNILYTGGSFFVPANPPNSLGFAKWNPITSTWSIDGTGAINSVGGSSVSGFALTSLNNLYVAGQFTTFNGFTSSAIVLVNYYQQNSQTSTFYLPLRKSLSKKWIKLNK